MKRVLSRFGVVLFGVAIACGPNAKDGGPGGPGDGPDAGYQGETATISGVVWAPGNAPGTVPTGHEIPIYDALVYLTVQPPPPIPQETYCETCVEAPGGTFTDNRGHFTLSGVIPNTYWLVIQKGQFRIEQQIIVDAQPIELPAEQTTLPSIHDPTNGKWVPRIALAAGVYDDLEDILGKMGLGNVDSSGKFVANSAAGNFDVYSNGGAIDSVAIGSLGDLTRNLNTMLQYHIIFIPCGSTPNVAALQDQQTLMNIHDYVAAGGKLYVTDWSGEWADNVFPEQVTLYDGGFGGTDTPASAFNEAAMTWDTSQFGDADGSPSYTSDNAEALDPDLHAWLDGQSGPRATSGEGVYDASDFDITGNWNHIESLTSVQVGTDDEGFPIMDEPKAFIIGDDGLGGGKKPLTVTYEPTGCGRVLYSTYHTTEGTHTGLVPQERALLYLIMEIGVCKSGPIVD